MPGVRRQLKMEKPRNISNPTEYYLGAALGLLGLFFMVLDERWLELVNSATGGELQEHQFWINFVGVIPAIMLVVGLFFMLHARKERK